ncbi:hypothetical protein C0995_000745, partial [Termitomyces sp. Mi166
ATETLPAQVELDSFNDAKCPVTYDDKQGEWVPWQRPIRFLLHGGTTEVVASAFERAPYEPPQCPHVHEHNHNMTLHLKKRYKINCEVDFFRATGHVCDFTVVIPSLNEPIVTQDLVMIAEQMDDLNHLATPYLSPSEAEVSELLMLKQLLTPPSSSNVATKYRDYFKDIIIDTRVSPALYMPTKPFAGSRPHPKKPVASSSNVQPFFEKTVTDARAKSTHPWSHPAASLETTHHILEPYDERIFPGCLARTFEHLQYVSSDIGTVVQELNSTLGVPLSAINTIVKYAITCPACQCTFSIDGFNAHLADKRCRNCTSTKEGHKLILHRFTEAPAEAMEFIDTPIGAAFME